MIKIIKNIENYLDYIATINKSNNFFDPVLRNNDDYIKMGRKDKNIVLGSFDENEMIRGIFSFLVIEDDKYAELLLASSKNIEAYEELFSYIDVNYHDYDVYFVYNPLNNILNDMLAKRNAKFWPIQMKMICDNYNIGKKIFDVVALNDEILNQYFDIHNNDIYWNAKRVIADKSFKSFVAISNGKAIGYIDIRMEHLENHIMDVIVLEEYRNKGYGAKLINKALKDSYPKSMLLEVDNDNYPARHLYEKTGFRYLPRENIITVLLRNNN